ncbi:MAG: hypothetical protein IPM42_09675 [Saprospiraceae bacterium]|nr:hypothetical protein [Saprospiraceae bacterium]
MKTKQIVCFFFLFQSLVLFSQIEDCQWVINDKGTENKCNYQNTITTPGLVCFEGFKHPSPIKPDARNDLFIIYEDGTFFNSYGLNSTWPQSHSDDSGFYINFTKKPIYLYWTNRYEGDDDNPKVKMCTPPTSPPAAPYKELIVSVDSPSNNLQVNHDVVREKDITVIIKKSVDCDSIRLRYNCGTENCDNLLKLDTRFSHAVIPIQTNYTNEVIFNSEGNAFINFRVLNIDNYADLALLDAQVNFTLEEKCRSGSWIGIASINVPIRNAHDPNYMMLNSICTVNGDTESDITRYANFYLQVQNTDETVGVNNVSIEMPFPACLNPSEVFIQKVFFNDTDYIPGSFLSGFHCKRTGNKIVFHFGQDNQLSPFIAANESKSIAAVEFCIKINNNCDVFNNSTPIFDESGTSYFNVDDYPIETYFDLVKRDQENNPIDQVINSSTCNCNFDHKCPCVCDSIFSITCCGRVRWPGIFGVAAGLILLGLFFNYFRRP